MTKPKVTQFKPGDIVRFLDMGPGMVYDSGPYVVDYTELESVHLRHMDGSNVYFDSVSGRHRHGTVGSHQLELDPFMNSAKEAIENGPKSR